MGELAKKAGCTAAWVSQIESGLRRLSADSAAPFAAALGVSVAFLTGADLEVTATPVQFRHVRSTKAAQRDRVTAGAAMVQHVVALMRAHQRLHNKLDLPTFSGAEPPEPEAAAAKVRDHWFVGSGVIPDLTGLLESWGAWVFTLPAEDRVVDAYSWWSREDAFIASNPIALDPGVSVAGDGPRNAYRERFSLAHELGHLVMHRGLDPALVGTRAVEAEAHRFAGAFLVPAAAWLQRSPRSARWQDYLFESARWGVSTSVLLRRDFDLGLVPEARYRSAMIGLSATVGRRSEGSYLSPRAPEQPRRLQVALSAWLHARAAGDPREASDAWTSTLIEKVRQLVAPDPLPEPRS
ncbi:MAG: ImmA/IrrE family metallo-endopeptidase [Deltaproteobacteria bacterium]|nr:ImmA/IrrE family metallo-endopeptidase [Deltaproteobacteria bacterium]